MYPWVNDFLIIFLEFPHLEVLKNHQKYLLTLQDVAFYYNVKIVFKNLPKNCHVLGISAPKKSPYN
jgi:hypothetical protein